jgi:LmbE family N-acetylglucosaminyl deacetylase
MPRLFSKSVIFLLVLLLIATTGNAETEIEKKRREILARRAHQRMQVNAMIRHLRQEQADHSSGKKVLDPKEKEELERRLNLYVMKVDSIKDYVDDEVSAYVV